LVVASDGGEPVCKANRVQTVNVKRNLVVPVWTNTKSANYYEIIIGEDHSTITPVTTVTAIDTDSKVELNLCNKIT